MSKKDVILLPIYFLIFLVVLYLCAAVFSLFGEHELSSESSGFRWVKEESYLLDYQITEDTIQFRYSMCFENFSDEDCIISTLSVAFDKSELSGWLEYNDFFSGTLDDEHYEVLIRSGERISAVFIFTGKYLGGSVNDKLSPPKKIMYISRFGGQEDGVLTYQ